jgi:hypothetical protein
VSDFGDFLSELTILAVEEDETIARVISKSNYFCIIKDKLRGFGPGQVCLKFIKITLIGWMPLGQELN